MRTIVDDLSLVGYLELSNLSLVYNNTAIRCVISSNGSSTLSNAVLLLIEGKLLIEYD